MSVNALPQTGWEAQLDLTFAYKRDKTILSERRQRGPLALQRPFYPEGQVCHAYILHPPGGVVGGDQLTLTVQLQDQAHALLTTPGATKFYRSAGLTAHQTQVFKLENSQLEWLPQENILFPATQSQLATQIHLDATSRFIGWEINCLGRPANQESFDTGQASFSTSLYRAGKPLLLDRLRIAGAQDLHLTAGLRSQPVFATLLATPLDRNAEILDTVREQCAQALNGMAGATVVHNVLVVRYLGASTASAQQLMRQIWQVIRPTLMQCPAHTPRIWNT